MMRSSVEKMLAGLERLRARRARGKLWKYGGEAKAPNPKTGTPGYRHARKGRRRK